jgi:hypothetical protein
MACLTDVSRQTELCQFNPQAVLAGIEDGLYCLHRDAKRRRRTLLLFGVLSGVKSYLDTV